MVQRGATAVRQRETAFEIGRTDDGQALNRAHRRRFLLSGLLKCGLCGGYTIVGKDRYGCATRRAKGTCANAITIIRQEIEDRVISGLKDKLMAPELVRTFVEEFQAEVNRLQAERQQAIASKSTRLTSVERKIAGILAAIEDGNYNRSLTERLGALEDEQEALTRELAQSPGRTDPASPSAPGGSLRRQSGPPRGGPQRPGHQGRGGRDPAGPHRPH